MSCLCCISHIWYTCPLYLERGSLPTLSGVTDYLLSIIQILTVSTLTGPDNLGLFIMTPQLLCICHYRSSTVIINQKRQIFAQYWTTSVNTYSVISQHRSTRPTHVPSAVKIWVNFPASVNTANTFPSPVEILSKDTPYIILTLYSRLRNRGG